MGMVQSALCDGGIVSQPYHHFKSNEDVYRKISDRLDRTRSTYLDADRDTRLQLLFDSATYALLTANTPLQQADRAFRVYRDNFPGVDRDELAKLFVENSIGFYNNKAKYITDNYERLDSLFVDVDAAILDDRECEDQALLMEAGGIGPAKSAFTLAMLGFTDNACLDTNVCQQLDIDPRVYEKYDASNYRVLVTRAFEQLPNLSDEVSPFLLQWILFDLNRGSVETHDLWFDHVTHISKPQSISGSPHKGWT